VRIVVAEDSGLVREGLVRLLRDAGFDVLADVATADDLIAEVERHHPEVVVTDIRMPPSFSTEGLTAAKEIRNSHPEVGILLLSQHVETRHAVDLLEGGGGVGYLLKDRVGHVDALVDAIARVAGGESVVDPEVVQRLLEKRRRVDPLERLTAREREILGLMAEGRSNGAICERLVLSPKTIEGHVARIFMKLDLEPAPDDHRRVLAVLAYMRG
jgi:DNA-binding NarL/FixJ family response regulator